jgi:hypothetical protein
MTMRHLEHLLVIVVAGLAAALLVSCGSSDKGLIPKTSAGPLRSDFEAVAQAAETGNGNCTRTEKALGKTERDFLALPAGVNATLRHLLEQGISNLHAKALSACAEPTTTATSTTSQTTSTSTTQTAPTVSTPAPSQPPAHPNTAPPESGGGTPAEEGAAESEDQGKGKGRGNGEGKGVGKEGSGEAESDSGGTSAGTGH